jgi:hypothetical protein
LQVKVQQALYYTAGKDRLLTIFLTRDTKGKRPDQRFYFTRVTGVSERFCRPMPAAGRWK